MVVPLVVVHTIHDANSVAPVRYEVILRGMLTEVFVYFRHGGNLGSFGSKISYNRLFYHYTKALLSHLFISYGKPECIHVHVPMKMGRVAMWAGRKWSIPYVVSEQSSAYLPGVADSYQNRNLFYRYNVKVILKKAKAVSNVSRSLADILQRIAGRNDIAVIRNAADSSKFFYRPVALPLFTFIHVSTLKEQKNIGGMLNAFAMLYQQRQDFCLQMVGGDDDALKDIRIAHPNASWLILHGTVDHEQVPQHMQQAHCLVMFSRDENFPCVIVEGLSCGLPTITSDAGGCPEAIEPGNGIVVSSGDEQGLLDALQQMMSGYHKYDRNKIATDAASRYNFAKIARDFIDLYKKSGINI